MGEHKDKPGKRAGREDKMKKKLDKIDMELVKAHGLTEEEYEKIKKYSKENLTLPSLVFSLSCGVSTAVIKARNLY